MGLNGLTVPVSLTARTFHFQSIYFDDSSSRSPEPTDEVNTHSFTHTRL